MKWTGYVDRNSMLHRLDPRIKLVWFVAATVIVVTFKSLFVQLGLLGACAVLWLTSGLGKEIAGLFRRMIPLLTFAFLTWLVIGLFEPQGSPPVLKMGPLAIETADVEVSAIAAVRIFLMVSVFFTVIWTTDFSTMIDGLQRLKVPYRVAFAVGLIFQMIPFTLGEFQTIADAQRSRGLELDRGGLFARIRHYAAVLFPLLIRSLHSAQNTALAMYLYRLNFNSRRTRWRKQELTAYDGIFCGAFFLLFAALIYMGVKFPPFF